MMNHIIRVTRGQWTVKARNAGAIVAAAGMVLLAAACGDSPSSTGSGGSSSAGGSTNSKQIAFSECMRSKGVANFPDPSTGGGFPKKSPQQLGVSTSRYRAAQNACAHLLPNGGSAPDQAQLEQIRAQGLRFAECMRHQGVPLPDPDSTGRIPDPASVGIDQGSPKFEAANQACGKYRPPYMPSNAQYNAYARANGS